MLKQAQVHNYFGPAGTAVADAKGSLACYHWNIVLLLSASQMIAHHKRQRDSWLRFLVTGQLHSFELED